MFPSLPSFSGKFPVPAVQFREHALKHCQETGKPVVAMTLPERSKEKKDGFIATDADVLTTVQEAQEDRNTLMFLYDPLAAEDNFMTNPALDYVDPETWKVHLSGDAFVTCHPGSINLEKLSKRLDKVFKAPS